MIIPRLPLASPTETAGIPAPHVLLSTDALINLIISIEMLRAGRASSLRGSTKVCDIHLCVIQGLVRSMQVGNANLHFDIGHPGMLEITQGIHL